MFFISPGQVFGIEVEKNSALRNTGWMLLVHPVFLWNIPLAKTIKPSTTGLSISEIAYELGFEHLQSFSKLFKTKTSLPLWNSGSRSIEVQPSTVN
jgi:spermidine/putrescine-binding protein